MTIQYDPNNPYNLKPDGTPMAGTGPTPTAEASAANSNPQSSDPSKPNYNVGGAQLPGYPAAPTTGSPTAGDLYGDLGKAQAAKTNIYAPDNVATTSANTRQDVLRTFQSQIDALNAGAAAARARITSEFAPVAAGRVGGSTATQSRRGLLGSDFGNAQTDNVNKQNADELSSKISASDMSYAGAMNQLIQFIAGEQDKEVQFRSDQSSKGADAKISEIQGRIERATQSATASAKAMLALGISDATNPAYTDGIKKIASTTGLTTDQVTGILNDTKMAQQKTKLENQKLQGEAAAAGRTTLSPGTEVIGADGKPIASLPKFSAEKTTDAFGNESLSTFNETTGKFGGGASPAPGGVTPAPVTLPQGQKPATSAPATSLSFDQYGLMANTDFKPDNQVDQLAQTYLDRYIKSGSIPTASTLGRALKPGALAAIESRAGDLYFKATGQPLPTPQIIKKYQDIIGKNALMANNLKIQEQTVSKNVDLSIANLKKNDLNSTGFKPLDNLINTISDAFNDPATGQLIAQNSTIQNELGSLLSIKNAGGTTMFDKMMSAGIITSGDNDAQVKAKVTALMTEAANFADAIASANADAYKITDPFLQDPQNPLRAIYSKAPSGTVPIVGPDGTQYYIPSANVDKAISQGAKRL